MLSAVDRRRAPSFRLLPLMALWANLHGGFVFGLVLMAPIALDAVLGADARSRRSLLLRWAAFGIAALLTSFATPYGWNALLASQKILGLGAALPLIMEWKPADFGSIGVLEICLLLGIGLALYRGIRLPPMRIVLLLGLLHMSFAQGRAAEILALVAPLLLAVPLARQIGVGEAPAIATPVRNAAIAGVVMALAAGTVLYASVHRFEPHMHGSPVAAVAELKKLRLGPLYTPPSAQGTLQRPGIIGGANWGGAAFDASTGRLYVKTSNQAHVARLGKPENRPSEVEAEYTRLGDTSAELNGIPLLKGPYAHLTALDLNRGTIAWRVPFGDLPSLRQHPALKDVKLPDRLGAPGAPGTIGTAGGLLFVGGGDGALHAVNTDTGLDEWSAPLPQRSSATPMTYRARNGKQFVVIAVGGRTNAELVAFALR